MSPAIVRSIAPDAGFLAGCARYILGFVRQDGTGVDLSSASLLLPNLKLADPLNQALQAAAGGQPLLLPRMETLSGMTEPWLAAQPVMPDVRRQLLLHALLRRRNWLDEGMLWDVVAELTRFFDVLTEHSVALPGSEAELVARLEAAFRLKDSKTLNFEARLVNALWRAEAEGEPSRTRARLLAAHRWVAGLSGPLIVLLESAGPGPFQALVEAAAARVPVLVLRPDRNLAEGALSALLAHVWPTGDGAASLHGRIVALSGKKTGAFPQRVRLVAAESLETLGEAVADQVMDWLAAGKRNIALVACDRLAARRARALLERESVLVQDETGWKMATTRVAAVVDAWLEVLASDAWHRALIDLLRAPYLLADLDVQARGQAIRTIEQAILAGHVASGLDRLRAFISESGEADALSLLDRLVEARAAINPAQTATMAGWLRGLARSLELLGALPAFAQDPAGIKWLEWLETRRSELATDEGRFRFPAWRTWFNRQMETELYRDESIDSPVIMTHLAATRLRAFEAAIVIGADAEHLAPAAAPGWLTHAGVRRELGLPGADAERLLLREDLAGLLLACDETVIAWQCLRRDEALMPAAEVAVLKTALDMVSGKESLSLAGARPVPVVADPGVCRQAAPAVPVSRVPGRLSASGLKTLVDCPYRYFARYVLRLAESDELAENMEKKDFGEQLHGILQRFHARYPRLEGVTETEQLASLEALTEDAFAGTVARNFQDHAWRLRWRLRLADYLDWQREREKAGWHWQAGEVETSRTLGIGEGQALDLFGRIDRIDKDGEDRLALLDYKSRGLTLLRDQAADPDDVQLAFYALLQEALVGEAGYVALDGEETGLAALDDPVGRAAALQEVIAASFIAMRHGAALPAQGTTAVCRYCEMRGLCRKDWVA